MTHNRKKKSSPEEHTPPETEVRKKILVQFTDKALAKLVRRRLLKSGTPDS